MMWGDDPGSIGGTGETTLMGPSIWGNPHSQAGTNSWGGPVVQNGVNPGSHTNSNTFPSLVSQSQHNGPRSAWDMPAPTAQQLPAQSSGGGWGAPPAGAAPPGHVHQSNTGWGNPSASGGGQPTPAGGSWGMPPPVSQQQGQWGSGTSPSGTSFAEAARKNVPQTLPVQQQQPGVRPPPGPGRGQYGSQTADTTGTNGWGAPQQGAGAVRVDQATPWDVPTTTPDNNRANEWRSDGTSHWGQAQQQSNQTTNHQAQQPPAAQSGWGHGPSPPQSAGVYGQQQSGGGDPAGVAQWNRTTSGPADVGWGSNPGGGQNSGGATPGWGKPADISTGRHQSAGPDRSNWDHNPTNPSMWVAPAPSGNAQWGGNFGGGYSSQNSGPAFVREQRDDMMWHDPNPKTKKILADKGTGCWGDPAVQGPVQRWKLTSDDGPTEGGATMETPSLGGPSNSVWDRTPVEPQHSGPAAPGVAQGNPALVTKSASIAAPGWGGAERTGGPSDWDTPPQTDWNSPASVIKTNPDLNGGPSGLEVPTPSEKDVFSANPVTPLTPMKPSPGKGPEMTLQNLIDAQGPMGGTANLRDLTQQIAQQLRVAVSKGLINISILNQPLPQNVLLVLNQLLQRVPKLEQAKKELATLQANGGVMNESQLQEQKRLQTEIQRLEVEIRKYQEQISQQMTPGGRQPGTPTEGAQTPSERSKLDQWKNASGDSSNGKIPPSMSAPNLDNMENALGSLKFVDNGPWGNGPMLGTGGNWSPPSTAPPVATSSEKGGMNSQDGTNGDSKSDGGGSDSAKSPEKMAAASFGVGGGTGSVEGARSGTNSATPTFVGAPEFVPGKKWEWKDPKEVAEDPNATPGSLKNLGLASSMAGFGGGFGPPQNAQMSGVGIFGGVTPTKMPDFPRPAVNMGAPNNMYPGGNDNIWGMRNRPPMGAPPFGHNMGGPPGARMGGAYGRSISTPTPSSAFAPYNQIPTWVVLNNVAQTDEMRLKAICGRLGRVASFVCPPGATFACLKFSPDTPAPLDQIMPRLSHEVGQMGISVQVAKEPDIDNLIRNCMPGPRPNQPMMPPNHGIMWPEQGGTPWGAPPFAGGHGGPMGMPEGPMGPGPMGMPPPHLPNDGFMHEGY